MKRFHKFPDGISACTIGLLVGLVLAGCARESGPEPDPGRPGSGRLIAAKPVSGQVFTIPDLALDLMPIPAGTFQMGSPYGEPGRSTVEGPQTWVNLSRPYWLGRTAVTHAQWRALMGTDLAAQARKAVPGDENAARFLTGSDDDVPMYFVNWSEAMAFCEKLNVRARAEGLLPEGYEFALPTEAQWEYACRAGITDATYAGPLLIAGKSNAPVLDRIAWYAGNSSVGYRGRGWDTAGWAGKQFPGGTAGVRRVGLKEPNGWGLHDMLGNVYEWCRDIPADALPGGRVTDPVGSRTGIDRVVRGGSWRSDAAYCRAAYRSWNMPVERSLFIGFRLALVPVQAK